jgi:hypothetical protein
VAEPAYAPASEAGGHRPWGFDSLHPHLRTDRPRRGEPDEFDTLVAALHVFRAALEQEFEPYDERQRQLDASRE